jgi:hypothetical protein
VPFGHCDEPEILSYENPSVGPKGADVRHPYEMFWEGMFTALVNFRREHGHCKVPIRWPDDPKLATWVSVQRGARSRGTLSEDRIERLNEIGFVWDPNVSFWEEMFAALIEYKEVYGHCRVPKTWSENPKLADWVIRQRTASARGTLAKGRFERLDEIDFVWDPNEAFWEQMFAALVDFKKVHGHCRVPDKWSKNPKLGAWIGTQRTVRLKEKLSKDRIKRLDEIGFVWDPLETLWEDMFATLAEFKKMHGHCRVPRKWPENKRLANWVSKQRTARARGTLAKGRFERLDEIGFVWDPLETLWEDMFATLAEFKKVHGHCDVPSRWPENLSLANWVGTQRIARNKGTITEDRIKRLDDLGFEWEVRKKSSAKRL